MTPEAAAATASADDAAVRAHGERVERLLPEIRAMVGPPAWARVEELLRLLFELQGTGLERLLDHALGSGADLAELERRTSGDDLVSSLLLLHGLHPIPLRERIERALLAVRDCLGMEGDPPALTGIGEDGVARIRLGTGSPSARPSLAQSVRRAVLDAAPDLAGVAIEDFDHPAGGKLVTIGLPRERR